MEGAEYCRKFNSRESQTCYWSMLWMINEILSNCKNVIYLLVDIADNRYQDYFPGTNLYYCLLCIPQLTCWFDRDECTLFKICYKFLVIWSICSNVVSASLVISRLQDITKLSLAIILNYIFLFY